MIFKRPVPIPALLCSIGLNYESWSQRIRLYCRGKENGLQILQSIDQGPFKLGTTRDTLGITPEGGVLLGPERPHTYEDLSDTEKKRYDADVRGSPFNICLKWINPKISTSTSITTLKQKHFGDQSKMLHFQVLSSQKKDRESQLYDEFRECFKMPDKNQNQNQGKMLLGDGVLQAMGGNRIEAGMPIQNVAGKQSPKKVQFLDEEELLFLASEQGNTFDADADNQPVQDLALNEDNIFQADECDAFDSDVDDEPTAQTIFMANLSSAGSANPQAGPSNASILSEVHTLENAIDHSVTNQDEHEIHNEVQQSNVINSTSVYMEKNSDADPTLDLKALVSQNKDLTAKLNALHDLNERFRA
ncbi:hypothetical protein Tco_1394949 [Tanacetum coccineum]